VDANEHIIIGWEPVGNAAAYIIYRWESIWKPIDTVFGVSNTFYTDTTQDACNQSIAYSVATIDTCGSSGPKDEHKERKNMRIDTIVFNTCDAAVTVNWTKYRVPTPAIYQVWVSENGGSWQMAGEVSASESVFVHNNVDNGADYSYYIHTEFEGGSSTTCRKSVRTHEYIEPQFIYFANADVLPSQEIELTAEVDLDIVAGSWDIYRIDPGSSTAVLLTTIQRNDIDTSPLTYLDADVDPSLGSFTYFVKALDSCGFEKLESNTLKTIYLSGEIIDEVSNRLQWTPFEGWDATVDKYYIYRMMGEQEPVSPIDSVDAQTFEYTDDYASLGNVDGRFVYWIQAKEQEGNTYGYKEKSSSNRLNLFLESQMYFPNAFKPGGYTSVFKAVTRFFSGTAYSFQIYNRWGQLIFETNDPEEGWNGKYNGNTVEQGVYIYHLTYVDVYGKSVVFRGTVTVLY
jgi:gliding motility-associated-like protein